MTQSLSDFYRTKEIYTKLPSGGKWYNSPVKLTDDGEIGVLPMSYKDEMILKIPDSLYNGEALFDVIKSICPDITDPYEIAMIDVDVILIASRISTNEGNMQVTAKCPHCNTSENYLLGIASILSQIKTIDSIEIDLPSDLSVKFRPNTLKSINANQIKVTEASAITHNLRQDIPPDEAKKIFEDSLGKTTAASLLLIADSIECITLPNGSVVSDIQEILQWLYNIDSGTMKQLQKANTMQNVNGINEQFTFVCSNEECEKEFKSPVEFNPSFFFINN